MVRGFQSVTRTQQRKSNFLPSTSSGRSMYFCSTRVEPLQSVTWIYWIYVCVLHIHVYTYMCISIYKWSFAVDWQRQLDVLLQHAHWALAVSYLNIYLIYVCVLHIHVCTYVCISIYIYNLLLSTSNGRCTCAARALSPCSRLPDTFDICMCYICMYVLQPIADRMALNLEIISKNFRFSTKRTKIHMGLKINYLVLIVNPMGWILVRWKRFKNNLEIQCHSICNRLYLTHLIYVSVHICMCYLTHLIYVCVTKYIYVLPVYIWYMYALRIHVNT